MINRSVVARVHHRLSTGRMASIDSSSVIHHKCRNDVYPGTKDKRAEVLEDKVKWSAPFSGYTPVHYTSPSVAANPVWADGDVADSSANKFNWNSLDKTINRCSHMGSYEIVSGYPRNPLGRTGICGRGLLGKWGPNHAADPIVTRWQRTASNAIQTDANSARPILQFVAIQRADSGEWAIPGGMIDAGEKVSLTLKREFGEEAMNSLDMVPKEKKALEKSLANLFSKGWEVYKGYVDDPRNTDNAWMETVAVNFHDESGLTVGQFNLHAGSDAKRVRWLRLSSSLNLYASHSHFLKTVAEHHRAHW